jgi:hypothetical protein
MNNLVRMKDNYKKALGRLQKSAGIRLDPALSVYLKMTKDDLDALRAHYGVEQIENYIKEMELRREKNGTESG